MYKPIALSLAHARGVTNPTGINGLVWACSIVESDPTHWFVPPRPPPETENQDKLRAHFRSTY